ncbi:MAG: dUTP diphosphatase [Parvularculaceae bacterium]
MQTTTPQPSVFGDAAPEVSFLRLPHGRDLDPPAYQSALAAGCDLRAAVAEYAPIEIPPFSRAAVPTGIAIALPAGWEAQVRSRSGLALRSGVACLNAPGTIDADYRGEIFAILINHGDEPFRVVRGARIAQLIVAPAPQARFVEVDDAASLGATARGAGGFGSTGAG